MGRLSTAQEYVSCELRRPRGRQCAIEISRLRRHHSDGEIVEAGGMDDSAAIEGAFRLFAGKNKYGTGTLAVELPASLGTSNQILTLSPALLGLGTGLAAARLIERMKTDRLRLDEELVSDLLTVLAAAATGVAKGALAIGALRFQAGQKAFLIFREGVSAEKVTRALAALDGVADASAKVAKLLDAAGMAWGDLSALGQFAEVTEQERTGKLTHAEAKLQRAQAFFSALQNHVCWRAGRERRASPATGGDQRAVG